MQTLFTATNNKWKDSAAEATSDDSAAMVDTVLRTEVVKNIFSLQLFDDLCWHVITMLWYLALHTFLYLMCVCEICTRFIHWIAYVIKLCRYCSFLIGYQAMYVLFNLICGIAANISDFFWWKKNFNLFEGVQKSVPLNIFGAWRFLFVWKLVRSHWLKNGREIIHGSAVKFSLIK